MKKKLLSIALLVTFTPTPAQAGANENERHDWWCSVAQTGFVSFWLPCKNVNR